MGWILLLLSAACFAVLFLTKSFALGVICLLLSLLLLVVGVLSLLSVRIADASRDEMTPAQLRALRESLRNDKAESAAAPPATDD